MPSPIQLSVLRHVIGCCARMGAPGTASRYQSSFDELRETSRWDGTYLPTKNERATGVAFAILHAHVHSMYVHKETRIEAWFSLDVRSENTPKPPFLISRFIARDLDPGLFFPRTPRLERIRGPSRKLSLKEGGAKELPKLLASACACASAARGELLLFGLAVVSLSNMSPGNAGMRYSGA